MQAIIAQALWDACTHPEQSPPLRANRNRGQTPALLARADLRQRRRAMSPTHTGAGGRLYRYYVSQAAMKGCAADGPAIRASRRSEIEARGGRPAPGTAAPTWMILARHLDVSASRIAWILTEGRKYVLHWKCSTRCGMCCFHSEQSEDQPLVS